MSRYLVYGLLLWLGLSNCKTFFNMQLPPAVNDSFRADKIHPRPLHLTGTSVLEYRVISDSTLAYFRGDTLINVGIIFPRSRLTGVITSNIRVFGSDSLVCRLHYSARDIYLLSETHSLLSDIILPPDKYKRSYSNEEPPQVTYYYRNFSGSLLYDIQKDSARFYFEMIKAKKDLDTASINGRIYYGADSLVVQAYYIPSTKKEEQANIVYLLEGFGFYRQGRLLGFLQYAPLIQQGREKLYLRSEASAEEQLLIAAYAVLWYDQHYK
jgi:hypothetical protein